MKYSIIQSTEGNKYVQVKNERELRKLGIESCPNSTNKGGSKKNLVSIPSCSQQRLLNKNCIVKNFKKFSFSQEFSLSIIIVNIYPEDYKFIQNFTSSAEDLLTVIIKNDRNQNADLMLTIIKVYKTLEINEIRPKYK